MRSNNPTQSIRNQQAFLEHFVSLPFDDQCSLIHGQIRAQLTLTGELIGPYDFLIAAIALAHDLILVTHNTGEFSRVPNLKLEDWQTEL